MDSFQWDLVQDILLADTNGDIVYQTPRSNVTITSLKALYGSWATNAKPVRSPEPASQPAENKPKPSGTENGIAPDLYGELGFSRVIDVNLGGEPYKLYTIPLRFAADPSGESGSGKAPFIVAGIVSAKSFRAAQRRPLGPAVVTIVFLLALAGLALYPLLKFSLVNKADLITREAGLTFALQMIVTSTLFAGVFGQFYAWRGYMKPDSQLQALGTAIEQNLDAEVWQALVQLRLLEEEPSFTRAVNAVAHGHLNEAPCEVQEGPKTLKQQQAAVKRIKDLATPGSKPAGPYRAYPYFEFAYWTDSNAYQVIKWAPNGKQTEPTQICESPGFNAVLKDSGLWQFTPETSAQLTRTVSTNPAPEGFYIEPSYSGTTGKYLAHISRAAPLSAAPITATATIGTPLISLAEPIFLPGFGFAIVDPEGQVLFHSVGSKNQRENFLYACNRNQQLSDLVRFRQAGTLDISYSGVEHRAFVKPIKSFLHCPWSLIVFFDVSDLNADHVKAMIVFGILLGFYIGLLVFSVVLIDFFWIRIPRRHDVPDWIWPRKDYLSRYCHLVAALIATFLLTIPIVRNGSPTQLVLLGFIVPFAATPPMIVKLRLSNVKRATRWIVVLAGFVMLLPILLAGPGPLIPFRAVNFALTASVLAICIVLATLSIPIPFQRASNSNTPAPAPLERASKHVVWLYALVAWTFLLMVGFRPAFAFFVAASTFQNDVAVHRRQLQTATLLRERSARIDSAYALPNHEPGPARRLHERLDRYDLVALTHSGLPDRYVSPMFPEPLDPLLSFLAFGAFNYDGDLPGHLAGLGNHPESTWVWAASDGPALVIQQQTEPAALAASYAPALDISDNAEIATLDFPKPTLDDLSPGERPRSLKVAFIVILVLVGVIIPFLILASTITRLFGLDLNFEDSWTSFDPDSPGHRTIVLGLPASGKTGSFRDQKGYFDLVNLTRTDPLPVDWKDHHTLVLDHFEICCTSYLRNRRVLDFLEPLTRDKDKDIVIVSTVDPIYFLRDAKAAAQDRDGDHDLAEIDLDRWVHTLASFHVTRFTGSPSIQNVSRDAFYHMLWCTCSGEERLALNQLARHGWSNHAQQDALQHLYNRHLISADPCIRVNEQSFSTFPLTFGEYIRHCVAERDHFLWAPGEDFSAWDMLRITFLLVASAALIGIVWVFGDQVVAYVTTGAGAVTAAAKMLSSTKVRSPSGIKV